MKRDPISLRDQVAGPVIRRLRADRERVCETLKPALEVIERRIFDYGFDVNELWRESGLTKDRTTLFTAEVGESPGACISRLRLEVAKELLANTHLKVFQIGMALGYSGSANTFSKAFHRRFGVSPSAFRLAARAARDRADQEPPLEEHEKVSCLVTQVSQASLAGDFAGALERIGQARTVLLDQDIERLTWRVGIAHHERGAERTRDGDVDRAYDDLTFAHHCYVFAGELEPAIARRRRHLGVSDDTNAALMSALCPDCRAKLAGDEGHTLRQDLRRALRLIPSDLEWFEVCCDDCYRVVWSAISRARAGLTDDAWKAWWLSSHADLEDRETPPSRGRIIAALAEVERLVSGDQLARKGYCDLAVDDAVALGEPLLEAQARIWRASILRAMGEFTDARAELRITAGARRATPWLAALHDRMAGILESHTNHWRKALDLFQQASAVYQTLDPHLSGLLLTQQANVHLFLAVYEKSVSSNQAALSLLDGRRDPLPVDGYVPINSAVALALLGKWERAESALSRCRFQREAHPGLAATETFTRACLELLRGRLRECLSLFAQVKKRFELTHQPLDVALAAAYSVEAHARLGDREGAKENAVAALSFFQAAGSSQDTLNTVGKLQALLQTEVVDVMAVTIEARILARQNGGWLPDPEPS